MRFLRWGLISPRPRHIRKSNNGRFMRRFLRTAIVRPPMSSPSTRTSRPLRQPSHTSVHLDTPGHRQFFAASFPARLRLQETQEETKPPEKSSPVCSREPEPATGSSHLALWIAGDDRTRAARPGLVEESGLQMKKRRSNASSNAHCLLSDPELSAAPPAPLEDTEQISPGSATTYCTVVPVAVCPAPVCLSRCACKA